MLTPPEIWFWPHTDRCQLPVRQPGRHGYEYRRQPYWWCFDLRFKLRHNHSRSSANRNHIWYADLGRDRADHQCRQLRRYRYDQFGGTGGWSHELRFGRCPQHLLRQCLGYLRRHNCNHRRRRTNFLHQRSNQSQIATIGSNGGTNASDVLTGGVTIDGTTITPGTETWTGLAAAINASNLGVTATLNTASVTTSISGASKTYAIGTLMTLTSTNASSQGAIVTDNVADTTAGAIVTTVDTPAASNSAYYSVGVTGAVTDTTTSGSTRTLPLLPITTAPAARRRSATRMPPGSRWPTPICPMLPMLRRLWAISTRPSAMFGAGRLHRRDDQHTDRGQPGAQHAV